MPSSSSPFTLSGSYLSTHFPILSHIMSPRSSRTSSSSTHMISQPTSAWHNDLPDRFLLRFRCAVMDGKTFLSDITDRPPAIFQESIHRQKQHRRHSLNSRKAAEVLREIIDELLSTFDDSALPDDDDNDHSKRSGGASRSKLVCKQNNQLATLQATWQDTIFKPELPGQIPLQSRKP